MGKFPKTVESLENYRYRWETKRKTCHSPGQTSINEGKLKVTKFDQYHLSVKQYF